EVVRSTGHGFSGIARVRLLQILEERCRELGVRLAFETDVQDLAGFLARSGRALLGGPVDLVLAADGVRSGIREAHAAVFKPTLEPGRCRYVWLGTTLPLEAFTFFFERGPHGWFTAHAYRYDAAMSTFIAETSEETWRASGLDRATADESLAYLEA